MNYQCQFSKVHNRDVIGLERGADIPDVLDLDRYLVPDERLDYVWQFFEQLLYNHLGAELMLDLGIEPEDKGRWIRAFFTQRKVFEELVRAAEGNCRDFLCVFSRAYFEEFVPSSVSKSISKPNIAKAAAHWFDQEKLANIKLELDVVDTLTFIMHRVLKPYKARTFLVEMGKSEHQRLMRLLNERVLHKLNGTYSHRDRPGIRHELFTVDYGAFVHLRGTMNEIDDRVFLPTEEATEDKGVISVPVDDRRSIRRIVFDPDSSDIGGFGATVENEAVDLPLWKARSDIR